jgi:hypothetical protein
MDSWVVAASVVVLDDILKANDKVEALLSLAECPLVEAPWQLDVLMSVDSCYSVCSGGVSCFGWEL